MKPDESNSSTVPATLAVNTVTVAVKLPGWSGNGGDGGGNNGDTGGADGTGGDTGAGWVGGR